MLRHRRSTPGALIGPDGSCPHLFLSVIPLLGGLMQFVPAAALLSLLSLHLTLMTSNAIFFHATALTFLSILGHVGGSAPIFCLGAEAPQYSFALHTCGHLGGVGAAYVLT